MVGTFRIVGIALVLGTLALGTTGASAHGFGGGFHGVHGGIHGGWGHGWGHGGWGHGGWGRGGWGWGRVAFRPFFGGCTFQRYVNVYGELVARRVCY